MVLVKGFESNGFERNAKIGEKISLQQRLDLVTGKSVLFAKAPEPPKGLKEVAVGATGVTAAAGTDAAAFANELKTNFDKYAGKNFDDIAKKVSEELGIPEDQVKIGKAADGQKTIEVNGQVALKDSNGNGTLEKEDLEAKNELQNFATDLKKFEQNQVDAEAVKKAEQITLQAKINAIDVDINRLDTIAASAKANGADENIGLAGKRAANFGRIAA